jgi:hypothetical protein
MSHTVTGLYTRIELPSDAVDFEAELVRNSSVRDTATGLSVISVCRHTSTRPWNTAHDLV